MDPSPNTPSIPDLFGVFAGLGLVALLISIVVTVGLWLLGLWIAYSVIWRAVRRGLREYDEPQIGRAVQQLR